MPTATYRGNEMTATFSAELERWDYGVRGSPSFYDVRPGSIKLESLEILGLDIKLESLPENLQAAILELADELEFS